MVDCIVVGAGLAGLATASELVRKGRDVVVLEARSRVGGRVENVRLPDGHILEMGGQWLGPGHDAMYELVSRFGLTLLEPSEGDLAIRIGGRVRHVPTKEEVEHSLTPFEISDLGQGLLRLRRLAERVRSDAAWAGSNATWLDQGLLRWVSTNVRTPGGQEYFTRIFEGAMRVSIGDMTLGEALRRVNDGVDLESLVAINGGLKQERVAGGIAQVADLLAAELGDRLRLGTPVSSIRQDADQIVVTTRDGEEFTARSVVVTLPPRLAAALEYSPPLPESRQEVTDRVPVGNVIKAALVYPTPWWKSEGFSGQMGSDEGPIRVIFDNSVRGYPRGVLMGFFEGVEASGMSKRSASLRERAFVEAVVRVFGEAGRKPIEYLDRDWLAEEFTGGCHGAHFAPGIWTASGPALAEPVGRIHFAGAEYASRFNGYMEGAVRSGTDVAGKVNRLLG